MVEQLHGPSWIHDPGRDGILTRGSWENAVHGIVEQGIHTRLEYNAWTGRLLYEGEPMENWHISVVKAELERSYAGWQWVPTKGAVADAMERVARYHSINPRLDQIGDAREWPNTYREFAIALGQDPDDDYQLEVVKLLVRGVVARSMYPGCDFPYCIIITSPHQGAGKGHTLKALAGSYHSQLLVSMFGGFDADRKLVEKFRGKSVVEIGEFSGVQGRTLDTLKSLITDATHAGVRMAFGREAQDWPMTAILVGTTNNTEFLTDDEHRRHPVIAIPDGHYIDLGWLRDNVWKLWQHAKWEFVNALETFEARGEYPDHLEWINDNWRVQLPPGFWAVQAERSAQYRETNPLDEWVSTIITAHPHGAVWGNALFEAARQQFKCDATTFSKAMRAAGWTKKRIRRGEERGNCWTHHTCADPKPDEYRVPLIPT